MNENCIKIRLLIGTLLIFLFIVEQLEDLTDRERSYNLMMERFNLGPAYGTRQRYLNPAKNIGEENLFQL